MVERYGEIACLAEKTLKFFFEFILLTKLLFYIIKMQV